MSQQFRNCLSRWDSRPPRPLLPRSEFYLSRMGIRRLFTLAQSSAVGLVSMAVMADDMFEKAREAFFGTVRASPKPNASSAEFVKPRNDPSEKQVTPSRRQARGSSAAHLIVESSLASLLQLAVKQKFRLSSVPADPRHISDNIRGSRPLLRNSSSGQSECWR